MAQPDAGSMFISEAECLLLHKLVLEPEPQLLMVASLPSPAADLRACKCQFTRACWAPDDSAVLLHFWHDEVATYNFEDGLWSSNVVPVRHAIHTEIVRSDGCFHCILYTFVPYGISNQVVCLRRLCMFWRPPAWHCS